mmetsp:Transcript_36558/g.84753  ORF Transcript_36558/g.84753 Transcript_36558/m.84753 type:complete len:249 (+) Transcript_36558:1748-2494(+)
MIARKWRMWWRASCSCFAYFSPILPRKAACLRSQAARASERLRSRLWDLTVARARFLWFLTLLSWRVKLLMRFLRPSICRSLAWIFAAESAALPRYLAARPAYFLARMASFVLAALDAALLFFVRRLMSPVRPLLVFFSALMAAALFSLALANFFCRAVYLLVSFWKAALALAAAFLAAAMVSLSCFLVLLSWAVRSLTSPWSFAILALCWAMASAASFLCFANAAWTFLCLANSLACLRRCSAMRRE